MLLLPELACLDDSDPSCRALRDGKSSMMQVHHDLFAGLAASSPAPQAGSPAATSKLVPAPGTGKDGRRATHSVRGAVEPAPGTAGVLPSVWTQHSLACCTQQPLLEMCPL